MSSRKPNRKHRGLHEHGEYVPSKNEDIPDHRVTDSGILAEYIRRPKLWTLPVIILSSSTRLVRLSNGEDAALMGCIYSPYDLHTFSILPSASRRVRVVIFTDSTTLPGLDMMHKTGCVSIGSIVWLTRFYDDARKMIYVTPEDVASDGWYMT